MSAPGALAPRWRQVLRGEDRELARLRRWLADLLPDCAARDDVIAVAHELAANATRHSASGHPGGWIVVEITWYAGQVRVAVADQGGPGEPHLVEDSLGEHGRGLRVVAALSARWSVSGDHRGRLVAADVSWAGTGAAPPPGFGAGYEAAISDATALLTSRHAGTITWFGHATQQWWALAADADGAAELIPASSPQELDRLLQARPCRMLVGDTVTARSRRQTAQHPAPAPPRDWQPRRTTRPALSWWRSSPLPSAAMSR